MAFGHIALRLVVLLGPVCASHTVARSEGRETFVHCDRIGYRYREDARWDSLSHSNLAFRESRSVEHTQVIAVTLSFVLGGGGGAAPRALPVSQVVGTRG